MNKEGGFMLCQDCKKRQAEVHFTQIVNNQKVSLSLCKECAAKRGFHSPLDNMPFPLAEILSGLASNLPEVKNNEPIEDLVCPNCNLTFEEFTRQGRFGCGNCYKAFRHRLEQIMRKIHGASLHRGRNPQMGTSEEFIPVKEEERLELQLRKAIDDEEFERAAEIRDKLKSMKENIAADNLS